MVEANRFDAENLLDFSKANILKPVVVAGLNDDEEVTLQWQVPIGSAEELKKWLWANRESISDFTVQFRVHEGTYRSVDIVSQTVQDDSGKKLYDVISHKLAKGFFNSIDSNPANWTWARVSSGKNTLGNSSTAGVANSISDDPERILIVKFPYCNPDYARAMANSLSSPTYAGPVIRGETYSGEWHNISCGWEYAEDGSAVITLFLARPQYVLEAYSYAGTNREQEVVYLWNVPKDLAQDIIDDWKTANPSGSFASCSYNTDQAVVDIVLRKRNVIDVIQFEDLTISDSCRYTQVSSFFFGVTDLSSYPCPTTTPGSGITYDRKLNYNEEDGTWIVEIITTTRKYQDTGLYESRNSTYEDESTRSQLGVTTQSLESISQETGKVKDQTIRINDDCSKDVETKILSGNPVSDALDTIKRSAYVIEDVAENRNQSTPVTFPISQNPGYIVEVVEEKNKFGLLDQKTTTLTAVEQNSAIVEKDVRTFESRLSVTDRNKASAVPPSTTPGVTTRSELNEFKLFDNTTTTITPINPAGDDLFPLEGQSREWKRVEEYEIEVGSEQKNLDEPAELPEDVNDPDNVDGTIRKVENEKNSLGKFDVTKTNVTAVKRPESVITYAENHEETLQTLEARNLNDADVPPIEDIRPGTGQIVTRKVTRNQFGKLDSETTVRTVAQGGENIGYDSGWVEYTDIYGTSKIRVIKNMEWSYIAAAKNDFSATTQNSLSFQPSEYKDRFSATLTQSAAGGINGGGGNEADDKEYSFNIALEYGDDAGNYTIYVWYTQSLTRAQKKLNSVAPLSSQAGGHQSGIFYKGRGWFRVTAVVRIVPSE